jgi:hypothetical protein
MIMRGVGREEGHDLALISFRNIKTAQNKKKIYIK